MPLTLRQLLPLLALSAEENETGLGGKADAGHTRPRIR